MGLVFCTWTNMFCGWWWGSLHQTLIIAQAIFNFISVETCSSKIRGQKRVLNTFCCHGWEMWHHFINGQRAGSEMWGSGAPWLWEKGNGNSQGWLSHGPSLRLVLLSRASVPSRDKDTGTNPAFTGLQLWENRWALVLLQNVPNSCFLVLGKSFELLWCQCSDCRVGCFVFNLILVDWGESFEESNFCVSS